MTTAKGGFTTWDALLRPGSYTLTIDIIGTRHEPSGPITLDSKSPFSRWAISQSVKSSQRNAGRDGDGDPWVWWKTTIDKMVYNVEKDVTLPGRSSTPTY